MGKVLLFLVAVGLTVYALLDLGRTRRGTTRLLPKLLWFLVVFVPVLGPVAWLTLGRPRRPGAPTAARVPGASRRRPAAPDDDPAFLRRLDEEAWRLKMQERRRHDHPSGAADSASGTDLSDPRLSGASGSPPGTPPAPPPAAERSGSIAREDEPPAPGPDPSEVS